jgi:hypothetical protein
MAAQVAVVMAAKKVHLPQRQAESILAAAVAVVVVVLVVATAAQVLLLLGTQSKGDGK